MRLLIYLLVNGLAVYVSAQILLGVHVDGFWTAVVIALVMGALNFFLKPILIILTLPITLITLGIFTLVINVFIVYLVDLLIQDLRFDGIIWLFIFSITTSLFSSFLNKVVRQ